MWVHANELDLHRINALKIEAVHERDLYSEGDGTLRNLYLANRLFQIIIL